jgi:hypothetical protein
MGRIINVRKNRKVLHNLTGCCTSDTVSRPSSENR